MGDAYYLLPLGAQIALGGGYLGQYVAFVGLRRSTSAIELTMRSLAFGIAALLAFGILRDLGAPVWASTILAVASSVAVGALWRRWGMDWANQLLKRLKITSDDGIPDAWTALIQSGDLNIMELSVHTKDGRVLYHEREAYGSALMDGMYFGSDGSIIMVVVEEELPDGTMETRERVDAAEWGVRQTYIPADQIARVNFRSKPPSGKNSTS